MAPKNNVAVVEPSQHVTEDQLAFTEEPSTSKVIDRSGFAEKSAAALKREEEAIAKAK